MVLIIPYSHYCRVGGPPNIYYIAAWAFRLRSLSVSGRFQDFGRRVQNLLLYRVYIWIIRIQRGYIGIMEKKMEATI